ncbi:MAG: alpha/beta hydrolase [Chlorobi bacterium]|nr:alpha/beta hydrolase [Chlorobiota bacterium]
MKNVLILVLLLSLVTKAQDLRISLWGDNIPNYQEVGEKETPNDAAEIEHYRLVTNPDISVYLPAKKNSTGQAVLIIPGGGYGAVVYKWEGTDIAKWLNAYGIAGIVLKYRLPHAKSNIVRDKSPLLDASRAMKMIRANAEKWHIDKNNIGVMGFSAGGHLASTLGTHYDRDGNEGLDEIDTISSRPDFMVLMYPVITMDETFTHMGSRKNLLGENPSQELIDYYSNEKQVTENTPTTFLVHASDDKVVPVENSIRFYESLHKHGVKAEMHIFEYGGHGFALANGKGYLESWKDLCIDWLRHLGK